MDNQRLLTWALFGMMAWLSYQAWMLDYGPQPTETPAATQEPLIEAPDDPLPQLTSTDIDAPAVQPSLDAAPAVDDVADRRPGNAGLGEILSQRKTKCLPRGYRRRFRHYPGAC